ncbi:unnamed protein product, partial [Musa hybrid cultivar]
IDCIKSRPLPTVQCTPGHPCPKPSDSFSRATTAAFPRRSSVFLPIGEQRTQRRCLPPLSSCRCGVFLSIGETESPPPRARILILTERTKDGGWYREDLLKQSWICLLQMERCFYSLISRLLQRE